MSGDAELALALAAMEEEEAEQAFLAISHAADASDLVDPNPDLHALFLHFNAAYFQGKLEAVEVVWSPKMTLCAGVCSYQGRYGLCRIALSEPLLKFRPRSDMINTLLHECIHAFLFVTQSRRDRSAHGPEFLAMADEINRRAGTNITVYHTFNDEVDLYRQHWWRCQGPCRTRPPFFGYVKRSMNRPPQPADTWWSRHQQTCGGLFEKIKSPPPPTAKSTSKVTRGVKRKASDMSSSSRSITDFLSLTRPVQVEPVTFSGFTDELRAFLQLKMAVGREAIEIASSDTEDG